MQGGSSVCLTEFLSHRLPLPSARLCSLLSPFSFSSFDWSRGMVIFMHHLGRQDGRTSSNYLKQTRPRLLEKLPLYSSSWNKKTDWEHNGFKTNFTGHFVPCVRYGFHLRVSPKNIWVESHFSSSLVQVVWFIEGCVLFKCYSLWYHVLQNQNAKRSHC